MKKGPTNKLTVAHLVKKFPIFFFMQLTTDYRVYKSLHNGTHEKFEMYAVAKDYLQRQPKAQFMGCLSSLHPVSRY